MRAWGCRRFSRLLNELADREARPDEDRFLQRHRAVCETCRLEEAAAESSLSLLRGSAFSADVEDSFDRRVIRRVHVQKVQEGFLYWRPAFLGGIAASALLLAAVQSLTKPIAPGATSPVQASRSLKPSLALRDVPNFAPARSVR